MVGTTFDKVERLSVKPTAEETVERLIAEYPRFGNEEKEVLKVLSRADIRKLPKAEWLVHGLLQTSTVSLMYGATQTGKSFITLHLVAAIARGEKWMGKRVKQGDVLYIYAEGSGGLDGRLSAWEAHHRMDYPENVNFVATPVSLIDKKQVVCDTVESFNPSVVIIDTFSMCAPGINENDAPDVAKWLAVASHLKHTYGCHVMIIHHTTKGGDFRGSTAFTDNTDTVIEVSRENKTSPIHLECWKQRDGALDELWVNLEVVHLAACRREIDASRQSCYTAEYE